MVLELAMPLVTTGYRNVASGVVSQSLGELMVSLQISDCKGVGNVGETEEKPSFRGIQE